MEKKKVNKTPQAQIDAQKRYYQRNREARLAYFKKYSEENADKIKARKYSPEQRAKEKERYQENREIILEKARKKYAKNKKVINKAAREKRKEKKKHTIYRVSLRNSKHGMVWKSWHVKGEEIEAIKEEYKDYFINIVKSQKLNKLRKN